MAKDVPREMKLAELAARADLPGRTVRYYISRGLLPGPVRAGREARYGTGHLERLREIKELQARGRTLGEIGGVLAGADERQAPAATSWSRYHVAADVEVWVRAEGSPWRHRQIQRAVAEMAARLATVDDGRRSDEPNA